ncbi:DUF3108 domain-containing protein [Oxalobacteraceae bacterium OM1]|nr:DUF3108 domain-containing protein [Oxalobacteraceae bacterium OM1]
MISSLRLLVAAAALATIANAGAADTATPGANYRVNLPPSAELNYVIKSRQSGIPLEGNAVVQWTAGDRKFTLATEARAALLGKILDSKSEGLIDEHGLAPLSFVEKRFRRDQTVTTFDRTAGTIRFSTTEQTLPIQPGEQDRNSAVWQLAGVARAAPGKFKAGSEWTFLVAGQRDADPWTFKVVRQEKIRTPLGEISAVHVIKEPPADSKEQQVDIWLGPQHEWYPVRIRYTDADGDYIEQSLNQIQRKES